MNEYKNKSDDELVTESWKAVTNGPASVEMMRRLKNSIDNLDKSSQKSSKILVLLTILLFTIGIFQLLISLSNPEGWWLVFWFVPVVALLFLFYKIFK